MRRWWNWGHAKQDNEQIWMGYFRLLEELEEPGCVLCNRVRKYSWRLLDNLYYESVTDGGTRAKLCNAKGFCNLHAWMSMEIPNSESGIAIIYKDLLDYEITQLARCLEKGKHPAGWKARQAWKRNVAELVSSWRNRHACPTCKLVASHAEIGIRILLDFIDEKTFAEKFDTSTGLCIRHLIKTCEIAGQHPNLSILVEKQLAKYRLLSEELGEFDRKRDYRFAAEPKGSERDSWRRAIAQFAGLREIFGNDLDRKK